MVVGGEVPLGAVTANEIHVPAGKPLVVRLESADVVHDFWVPELGRKMDAIPGRPTSLWMQADQPGAYEGACAEYCGVQHAWMKLLVAMASGKPVELLQAVEERYRARPRAADTWHWRTEAGFVRLARGRSLAIEHRGPFDLHYGSNGWRVVDARIATRGPFGVWSVTFTPAELEPNADSTSREGSTALGKALITG
ncbi:MAG: hypothetical protein WBY94_04005 [Polyangiaceae bacterium]